MLVTSERSKHLHNLPTSITIGNAQILLKQSVKNLGFTLDCHLTMNAHVSNIVKLTIFKDLYGQAKHKFSKLVHSAMCKSYTERIALASSSNELHQIVNTLSNRHPPKILPTIYPSADLPSIFIKHFTNKVEKLRANITSEHVTSTLVTGTTAATFSSF